MWYLASIPFALFTIFLIYRLVSEREVNLAIDDERNDSKKENHCNKNSEFSQNKGANTER